MPSMLSSPVPLRRLAMPILATLLLTGASAIAFAGDLSLGGERPASPPRSAPTAG